jgi:hypothetical protein
MSQNLELCLVRSNLNLQFRDLVCLEGLTIKDRLVLLVEDCELLTQAFCVFFASLAESALGFAVLFSSALKKLGRAF